MSKEIQIIPTVMPENESDFREKIFRVSKYAKVIQIDVMDGKFVSSKSWPYNDNENKYWHKLILQEEGLPEWESVYFEIDLMVKNQLEEAKNWLEAGVSRIIGHFEAFENLESIRDFINLGREYGSEVYLALAPSTSNSVIDEFLPDLDGVQFMGIEKVGYQNQPFAPIVIDKVRSLRNLMPNIPISVDGGVSPETSSRLVEAGATALSSGSYIFKSSNPKEAIENLKYSAEKE